MTVEDVADRVGQGLGITTDQVWLPGRHKQPVVARSRFCFWGVHELDERMTALDRRLGFSTTAVSQSAQRGARIADGLALKLISRGRPKNPLGDLHPINSRPCRAFTSLFIGPEGAGHRSICPVWWL